MNSFIVKGAFMENNHDMVWPRRSSEQHELFAALCNAQAEMPIIDKNKLGRFKYADFAQVVFMTRPILTKHGLCVTQDFIAMRDGSNFILTTLAHISGQWRESVYALPRRSYETLDKGQSLNAAAGGDITYYKRYSYCAIIGCAISDEDYDGEPLVESKKFAPKMISPAQKGLLLREIGNDVHMVTVILKKESISSLDQMPQYKFNRWLDRVRGTKTEASSADGAKF